MGLVGTDAQTPLPPLFNRQLVFFIVFEIGTFFRIYTIRRATKEANRRYDKSRRNVCRFAERKRRTPWGCMYLLIFWRLRLTNVKM